MAIFDLGDKIQRWKYIVKHMKINTTNQFNIDIPTERIKELSIEENFEEYYFPLIKIKLILTSEEYYWIIGNKNNCKINIRIDKFYLSGENNTRSVTRRYINDTFELILDEANEDMYRSVKEDEYKTNYISKIKSVANELDKIENEVYFYLFKPIISNVKKNVNKILTKCNVSDAIVYLASTGGINNILMGQPDNQTVYEEFLIPPLSIIRALEFIDYYYGLYKEGSIIYFGLNYTYIIPYNGKCVASYSGEKTVTNIIIPKSTNITHSNELGTLNKINDKTKNYIVADYSSINIENQSISNSYINANNLEVIDSYESIKTSGNSTAISKDDTFTKIIENKTMNTFFTSTYTAQSNCKSTVISLRLKDFDVSVITPNKEFNLIFEDINYTRKYNGKYLIAGVSHLFLSEGEYLGVSSTLVLRKVN